MCLIPYNNIPKAASSIELPWPTTAVSMRLINGPHNQSPVAGPVNNAISFIWTHILCSASSFLSSCSELSLILSPSSDSLVTSWFWTTRVVTNLNRWCLVVVKHWLERTVAFMRSEAAGKWSGKRWFECVGDGKGDMSLGILKSEVWRVRSKCSESLCAIVVFWKGKKPMSSSQQLLASSHKIASKKTSGL